MISRRKFLSLSSLVVAGAIANPKGAFAQHDHGGHGEHGGAPAAVKPAAPVSVSKPSPMGVVTPNGVALPGQQKGDAKVYHLVAEPIRHEMAPGLELDLWGYNGRSPGPTIEAIEGDLVRIYVTNRLPAPTTVHWHGIELPNGMDGVAGLNQRTIKPGETFKYEFRFPRAGTFMYHPHFDELTQMAMGMTGMIVVHPRRPTGPKVDRDFAIMLAEWAVEPGARRPNPMEMSDFNLATMNSRVFPGTEPLVVGLGERVRIRLCNLSIASHHPIHLHGHHFVVTASDGGPVPLSAQKPETTILVPTGSVRDIEFIANNPGDWAMHCHMLHHLMNQMGHVGPSMVGVNAKALNEAMQPVVPEFMAMGSSGMMDMDHAMETPAGSIVMLGGDGPFGEIDMAGMFTILKVRKGLKSYEDPGWYQHPEGTVANVATAEELARDGIDV